MIVCTLAVPSVHCGFRDASASRWQVFRDPGIPLGQTALSPVLTLKGFTDLGGASGPGNAFYRIKGMSPCLTAGP